jgi:drug/metabolite transporter (DMT)-like permease
MSVAGEVDTKPTALKLCRGKRANGPAMTTATQRAELGPATPMAGIAMALCAFAMFTAMDTCIKLLGGRYHVLQVMFLNSVFALPAVAVIAAARGRLRLLWPRHWRLHLARWSISYLATIAIFSSFPHLALADAYAILFTAPLLITALSAVVLGERVGWRCWTAVAVGFGGVLVVLDPGHGMIAVAGLIVLAGAVGHAFNMLFVRKLAVAGEAVEATGTAGNLLTCAVTPLFLPWLWQTPSTGDLGITVFAGAVAGSAFLLLAAAFRAAPAAVIAPFQYSQMLYALAVGWLLFADWPSNRMLLGSVIIAGSGLYVLRHETRGPRSGA